MHTHHTLKHTVNHTVKWHLVPWNCGLLYESLMTDDCRAVVEWHVAWENQSALRNAPHCYPSRTNCTWAFLWRNPGFHHQKLMANCISYVQHRHKMVPKLKRTKPRDSGNKTSKQNMPDILHCLVLVKRHDFETNDTTAFTLTPKNVSRTTFYPKWDDRKCAMCVT